MNPVLTVLYIMVDYNVIVQNLLFAALAPNGACVTLVNGRMEKQETETDTEMDMEHGNDLYQISILCKFLVYD